MKLHRFYNPKIDTKQKTLTIFDEEFLHQLKNVLRFAEGDELIVFDGKLNEAFCQIQALDKNQAVIEVLRVEKNTAEPTRNTVLYCSILKRENFEFVCQKATEIGVNKIVPIVADRTVKTGLKEDRLNKIIVEAAEQSGRGTVPKLSEAMSFSEAVELVDQGFENILFDRTGKEHINVSDGTQNFSLWIGPEGGWSESELNLAKEKKFVFASLSDLNFRAETAAIVACFYVLKKGPAGADPRERPITG